jgi:mannose-6-phosphate isomerase-like protein (cupin superfamily)
MNPTASEQGNNYSVVEIGATDRWKDYTAQFGAPPGINVPGKLFLHPILGLTGMEVSVNCLRAGMALPFYHKHHLHEELYLFLKGRGQFQVDGKTIEIHDGTILRVAPDGERTWRNNSNEDLFYLVIQAAERSIGATGTEDGIFVQRNVVWPD